MAPQLELKTDRQMLTEAMTLAKSFSFVTYADVLYTPADYETWDTSVTPDPERMVWLPLTLDDVARLAQHQFNTAFRGDRDRLMFFDMTLQCAQPVSANVSTLLVRTTQGLKVLNTDGTLGDPTGEFVPNTLRPMLNEDPAVKQEVMDTLTEWLASEEEAISLLRHFATALAPHWSAVKYVLLLGGGRNGKSLLVDMMQNIFGVENCSRVTRQQISEESPVVTALRGKLLNLVPDGKAVYLKDSGHEKSLIAGEPIPIRKLYSSQATMVRTNALFVECSNKEPKSADKSIALQARIVRFRFQRQYALNIPFARKMLSEKYTGALLSLLIDHYVQEQDAHVMLAPTVGAVTLQLEHMLTNSLALQFVQYLEYEDAMGAGVLLGMELKELADRYRSWRIKENDLRSVSEQEVFDMFRSMFVFGRKSKRTATTIVKVRVVEGFNPEVLTLLDSLRGLPNDQTAVVAD